MSSRIGVQPIRDRRRGADARTVRDRLDRDVPQLQRQQRPDRPRGRRPSARARTAQVSETLVEKTKGSVTQQESIDQLQEVQDQLQTMRRQLAAQQADSKLSDQVATLTEQVEVCARRRRMRKPMSRSRSRRPASVRRYGSSSSATGRAADPVLDHKRPTVNAR